MTSLRRMQMATSGGGGFPEGAMYEVGYTVYIGNDGGYQPPGYNATWEQVGTDTDWGGGTAASGYSYVVVVKGDGSMWHTGVSSSGQGGNGGTTDTDYPVQVGAESHWQKTDKSISCGNGHMYGIQNNGALWGWGGNYRGHLGDGTTTARSSPVQISSPALSWSVVACGDRHSCAISTAGTLWSTGFNLLGCLGQGDTTDRSNLTQIGSGTDWSKVANGNAFSLAVKTNGTLWAWGANGSGELGQGNTTNRSSPVQIGGASDNNWADVFASAQTATSIALKTDGTLWSWGGAGAGSSGHGNTTNLSSPVQIGLDTNWLRVSNTNNNCMGVKTNGEVWAWGNNWYEQLGLGDTSRTNQLSPVKVPDFKDVHDATCAYSHSRIIV